MTYPRIKLEKLRSITVLDGEIELGLKSLMGCKSLETLNATVTALGDECFDGCTSLKAVTLKDDITTIPAFAFNKCGSLESITWPSGLTLIDVAAFQGCSKLKGEAYS